MKATEVDPVEPSRQGGSVLYLRGGSLVLRRVVKPVDPATADQTRERAGVSAASRLFAYAMSPTQQAAVTGDCCGKGDGLPLWVWLYSILSWIGGQIESLDFGGCDEELPEVSAFSLSPSGQSITVDSTNMPSDGLASVRVPRPLSPGRIARNTDMRTMPAVALDTSTDFSGWYVGRFGRVPIEGQDQRAIVSVASGSLMTSTCRVEVVGGGTPPEPCATCLVDDPLDDVCLGDEVVVALDVCCEHLDSGEELGVEPVTSGWSSASPNQGSNCEPGSISFQQDSPAVGTFDVELRVYVWATDETLCLRTVSVTMVDCS